ncbi:MAG: hypothetical protein ACREPE_03495, partial [Lysobacter sp.]
SEATPAIAAEAFQVDLGAARPRVLVSAEEWMAHEARLEKVRKKAGKAVWDQFNVVEAPREEVLIPA